MACSTWNIHVGISRVAVERWPVAACSLHTHQQRDIITPLLDTTPAHNWHNHNNRHELREGRCATVSRETLSSSMQPTQNRATEICRRREVIHRADVEIGDWPTAAVPCPRFVGLRSDGFARAWMFPPLSSSADLSASTALPLRSRHIVRHVPRRSRSANSRGAPRPNHSRRRARSRRYSTLMSY